MMQVPFFITNALIFYFRGAKKNQSEKDVHGHFHINT